MRVRWRSSRPRALAALLGTVLLTGCEPRLVTSAGVNSARVAEIQAAIAELRGLPFVPPARIALLDADAMAATLTRLRESGDSLRILRLWALIDRAFGEPTADPRAAARRLPTDTSFGVYSPRDDTLFLSQARLRPSAAIDLRDFLDHGQALAELVVTHELAHAWQHRHFPALFAPTTDLDHWTMQRALREGDAEVTTLALTRRAFTDRALGDYLRFRRQMATAAGQHPETDRDWQLRYERATRYAYAVTRQQGWTGLNALLRDARHTTADLLQPAAALGGDDSSEWADDRLACPAGWTLAADTTLGAFHIPSLLHISPAPLAIDGWRGDRIELCRDEGSDHFAWRWLTRWDSAAAAARFAAAAGAHLQRRHPGAALPDANRVQLSPARWIERRDCVVAVADSTHPELPIAPPHHWQ